MTVVGIVGDLRYRDLDLISAGYLCAHAAVVLSGAIPDRARERRGCAGVGDDTTRGQGNRFRPSPLRRRRRSPNCSRVSWPGHDSMCLRSALFALSPSCSPVWGCLECWVRSSRNARGNWACASRSARGRPISTGWFFSVGWPVALGLCAGTCVAFATSPLLRSAAFRGERD